ncbi:MAG: hypothetical protein ACOYOJ_19305, partial [Alsobacter sp.]
MPLVVASSAINAGQVVGVIGSGIVPVTNWSMFRFPAPFNIISPASNYGAVVATIGEFDGAPRRAQIGVTDAHFFLFTAAGGYLLRYAKSGGAATAVQIAPTIAAWPVRLTRLTSGNLLVVYVKPSTTTIGFQIIDPNTMSAVRADTSPSETTADNGTNILSDVIALSGGGFVGVYNNGGNARAVRWDNAGNVVAGPVTIRTSVGTAYLRAVELSDGNIGVASHQSGASNPGLNAIVINGSTLAVIGTPVVLSSTTPGSHKEGPDIVAGAGFFALAAANGTAYVAGVVSNASV